MEQNTRLLERFNLSVGFVPVDLSASSGWTGDWVNMANYGRLGIILFKAAGASGEPPIITVSQSTVATGSDSKGLTVNQPSWVKQGTLTSVDTWTETALGASTFTLATGATQAIVVLEVLAEELDTSNGFTFVQASLADVGSTAQLGGLLYLLADPRYPDKPANMKAVQS